MHTDPLTFSWAFDPLEMPAINMKLVQHNDFLLNKLRQNIEDLVLHPTNITKFENLIFESITTSKGSKFISLFFWCTSIFIIVNCLFKIWNYGKCLKPYVQNCYAMIQPLNNNAHMELVIYNRQAPKNPDLP